MRHNKPAIAIAVLALFVALGGSAIAVGVANNSVGSKELAKVHQRSVLKSANTKNTAYAQGTASCKQGEELLGGGAKLTGGNIDTPDVLAESSPAGNGWYARASVAESPAEQLEITAICLEK